MTDNKTINNTTQPLNIIWMMLLSILVGVVGGFGSIIFRAMIGFVHNLLFLGKFNWYYNANVHTVLGPWGVGIILAPVLGSLIVTWLTQTFAPEARGHGVPEVMSAIYYEDGKIRPIVAVVKSIASAVSIGSGGSVGREGPIIQIGAAFGSTLGQIVKMPTYQRILLIAAGAGAGIASTFNAPISGLAFAIELMLVSVSASSVAIVAIATVTATHIGRLFLGLAPSFNLPALTHSLLQAIPANNMLIFIPFGIVIGLASILFIHSIYWAEDWFEAVFKNPYIRHMCGMLLLGVLIYLFMYFSGHYYIEGVGYAGIVDMLANTLTNPWFLLLLFFAKLLATSLTLGSGASGGVFSPSLFLGGAFGGLCGHVLNYFVPSLGVNPTFFVIAGMAGMISGGTGAVITAIVMTFEMTRDYAGVLPIMVTTAIAYAVRIRYCYESIYTLKLSRRGLWIPQGLHAAMSRAKRACNIMSKDFEFVEKANIVEWRRHADKTKIARYILLKDNDKLAGRLKDVVHHVIPEPNKLDSYIKPRFAIVTPETSMNALLRLMNTHGVGTLLIAENDKTDNYEDILGVITSKEIAHAARATSNLIDT